MKKNWTEEKLLSFLLDEEQVPYLLLARAFSKRSAARRTKQSSGRPPILKKCPICGDVLTAKQRREHRH